MKVKSHKELIDFVEIKDFTRYKIDKIGNVFSLRFNRYLKHRISVHGLNYNTLRMRLNGKRINKTNLIYA